MNNNLDKCPLCGREIADATDADKHHLLPRSKGGKNGKVVRLHRICHVKIHSVFSEKELALKYNTMEAISKTREIKKFIKWVQNKPSAFYDGSRDTSTRLGKRTSRNRARK